MLSSSKVTMEHALLEAQKIAFAPIIFQVVKVLKNRGLLEYLNKKKSKGATLNELCEFSGLSEYGIRVLCESAESYNVLVKKEHGYAIGVVGKVLLLDPMTRANFEFNEKVNYKGIEYLEESIEQEKPVGLQHTFGKSDTIYEMLTQLPDEVLKSWFAFDHQYSDNTFDEIADFIAKQNVKSLLDVGGNTGRWAVYAAKKLPHLHITILDHPGQAKLALANAEKEGCSEQVSAKEMDLLDHSQPFPKGFDIVWMSQFLDCFSKEDIKALLLRAKAACNEEGRIYINEAYVDRQLNDVGKLCVANTSPYFTALANGKSKMYTSDQMYECIEQSGLKVVEELEGIGFGHTLSICKSI